MDGPVDVIIAPRRRGQASMGGHHSGCICRGTPMTPGRHGFCLIDCNKNNSFVKIIYVSIWLSLLIFIKLYLINFSNRKKTLNNLSDSTFVFWTRSMGEIDESKAGARIGWLLVM